MKRILFFSCLLVVNLVFAQRADYQIYWQSGAILLPENAPQIIASPEVSADEIVDGKIYRILQFQQIPDIKMQRALAADGVELLEYLPERAYQVSLPFNGRLTYLQKYNLRSIARTEAKWKINLALAPLLKEEWAHHGEQEEIMVQFVKNIDFAKAKNILPTFGASLTNTFPSRNYAFIKIDVKNITRLASHHLVAHLDVLPPPATQEDNESRSLHETNQLDNEFSKDLRINGEGVIVQIRDDGKIGPHIDLKGRYTNITSNTIGTTNHGDQVTGVAGGAGNINSKIKGTATGAHYFITDYVQNFLDTTIGLHRFRKMMITNTSYSDGCNRYTNTSQTIDIQLNKYPKLMHVFSAGNNNGANCNYGAGTQWANITGGHKQGKNCIAAANLDDNMVIVSTSSRGPAHDGRLKPDIAAHGSNVNCATEGNVYTQNTGTSFSAPATAGVLALMYQTFRMENQNQEPDGALMKAVLLNTATEAGAIGPDYIFGWGIVNAQRAVEVIQNQQYQKDTLTQNEEKVITLKMPDNVKMAKIMVLWSDPEATPNTSKALVNDLDMIIVKPDSTTALPYKLNPAPAAVLANTPVGFGRDSLNNMEQIVLDNPMAGATYQIKVKGYNVSLGAQPFYITYDYYYDILKPIELKKEGFFQSELIPLRWITTGKENTTVKIDITTDGATWNPISAAVGINQTHIFTTLPKINTDKAQYRFTVNGKEYFTGKFSITETPGTPLADKICPDSMTFTMTNASLPTELLYLGEKYMEPIAKSNNGKFRLATPKDFFRRDDNWFTTRFVFDTTDMVGRRRNAVPITAALKNCPLDNDMQISSITRPIGNYSSQCTNSVTDSVEIMIKNNGSDSVSTATFYYQYGQRPIEKQDVDVHLATGKSKSITFLPKLVINGVGSENLKVWLQLPDGDQFIYNDTLTKQIKYNLVNVSDIVLKTPIFENFNTHKTNYPNGWGTSFTQNDNITWDTVNTIGSSGVRTRVMAIRLLDATSGYADELYSVPMKVDSSLTAPYLLFDVAYGFANPNTSDRLRIYTYDNDCNRSNGVLLKDLGGASLSTNTQAALWMPTAASHWATEVIDLSAYKGKTIVLGFNALSRKNSVLYLDNVRIENYTPKSAKAEINVTNKVLCQGDELIFQAKNRDATYRYNWTFTGGFPAVAIGPGPHTITYNSSGSAYAAQLNTTSPLNTDVAVTTPIIVSKNAVAKFSTTLLGLTVTTINTSTDATSYLWEFGNGNSSTDAAPTYTYPTAGSYTITLTATSKCNSAKSTRKVTVSPIAVNDIFDSLQASVQPNPNDGNFDLLIDNQRAMTTNIRLVDVLGRVVWSSQKYLDAGKQRIPFTQLNVSKGLYFVELSTDDAQGIIKFSVE